MLTLEKCMEGYGLKWNYYFQQLAPESDHNTIVKMVKRGITISRETDVIYRHIKPKDYAQEVLEKVKTAGHENMVLSKTSARKAGECF